MNKSEQLMPCLGLLLSGWAFNARLAVAPATVAESPTL
jgi:hypothetical protein